MGAVPDGESVLDLLRDWYERFISVLDPSDLDLLALWTLHTHVAKETYTTPRLVLDSPVPGAGKTTVLEHLKHLSADAVQMGQVTSSALLVRILDGRQRTLLIDEVDRNLDPKREVAGDLLAVLNTGYKVGATRPVLEKRAGGQFEAVEMPTYAACAMAGLSPNLPDDTVSRSITLVLLPDDAGTLEDSDWERLDMEADQLAAMVRDWADDDIRKAVAAANPEVLGVRGRRREVWRPLARVADVVGGRWPEAVARLVARDVEEAEHDRLEGLMTDRPAVLLLKHLAEGWPYSATFWGTEHILLHLRSHYPEAWGPGSPYGRPLSAQRMGRMLSRGYRVRAVRLRTDGDLARGYTLASLAPAWRRLGIPVPEVPAEPDVPVSPRP